MMVPLLPTAKATNSGSCVCCTVGASLGCLLDARSTALRSFVVGTVGAAFHVDPSVVRMTVAFSPTAQPSFFPANATPLSVTCTPDACCVHVEPAFVVLRISPFEPTTNRTV